MGLNDLAVVALLVVATFVAGGSLGAAGFWLAVGRLDRSLDAR